MKYFTLIALFFVTLQVHAQIAIDEPTEKEIIATPFDGSFMKFPFTIKEDVALGMNGEKVTFIKLSTFDFKNEDGSRVGYDKEDDFINKTFEIIGYEKDIYDYFLVTNEAGTYKWKVSSSQDYVLNKFLDAIKDKLLNQVFIPLHNAKEVEGLGGSNITINGNEEYKVTKVSYAKLSVLEFGIKVQLNEKIDVIYPTGENDQPKYFNGKMFVRNPGWINLKGGGSLDFSFNLIEKSVYEEFKIENAKFLAQIKAKEIAVGMSNQQVRWSWGMPSRSLGAFGEYDEIFDWGGRKLYFKKKILAKML